MSKVLARLLADAILDPEKFLSDRYELGQPPKEYSCSVCGGYATVFRVGCGLGLGLRLCHRHKASLLPTVEGV